MRGGGLIVLVGDFMYVLEIILSIQSDTFKMSVRLHMSQSAGVYVEVFVK